MSSSACTEEINARKRRAVFNPGTLVGLLFSYWQFELFGWLRRSGLMRYLLGLLNFPGTGPFVNRIKLLFGAMAYVHGYVRAPCCLFSFFLAATSSSKPSVVARYGWRFHRRHKRCEQLRFLRFPGNRNHLDIRRGGLKTNLRSSHLRSIRLSWFSPGGRA